MENSPITELGDTLTLTEFKKGLWLYDKTQNTHIVRGVKNINEVLQVAVTYYQHRLRNREADFQQMRKRVDFLVASGKVRSK